MDRIDCAVEEYKIVRGEADQALERRISILTNGLVMDGAVFAGAMALLKDTPIIAALALMILVPAVSSYVFELWYIETKRHYRASRYLHSLEGKIERLMKERDASSSPEGSAIEWEGYIRSAGEVTKRRSTFRTDMPRVVFWIPASIGLAFLMGVGIMMSELVRSRQIDCRHPILIGSFLAALTAVVMTLLSGCVVVRGLRALEEILSPVRPFRPVDTVKT